jgi:hypothetical protein
MSIGPSLALGMTNIIPTQAKTGLEWGTPQIFVGELTLTKLLFALHDSQALRVEFKQLSDVVFGFGSAADALEADSCPLGDGAAVAGRHGDKLHEVKGDIFIAARSGGCAGCFFHECLLASMLDASMLTRNWRDKYAGRIVVLRIV